MAIDDGAEAGISSEGVAQVVDDLGNPRIIPGRKLRQSLSSLCLILPHDTPFCRYF